MHDPEARACTAPSVRRYLCAFAAPLMVRRTTPTGEGEVSEGAGCGVASSLTERTRRRRRHTTFCPRSPLPPLSGWCGLLLAFLYPFSTSL
jgi:hypothetical protein